MTGESSRSPSRADAMAAVQRGDSVHETIGWKRRDFLWAGGALLMASGLGAQTQRRIRTIAGTGTAGTATDGAGADTAPINNPYGLVIGPDRHVYWADFGSNRVLRLDLRQRRITVVAGNGTKGHAGDGGPAA